MSTGWSSLPVMFSTALYSYEGMTVVSSPALSVYFIVRKLRVALWPEVIISDWMYHLIFTHNLPPPR